jgi:hypothetical protein
MSIKRSKQVYHGTTKRDAGDDEKKPSKDKAQKLNWAEQVQSQTDEAFVPYAQTGTFAKGAFVLHQVFGKGLVTAVEGSRIEVLFEAGVKKLVHAGPPSKIPLDFK